MYASCGCIPCFSSDFIHVQKCVIKKGVKAQIKSGFSCGEKEMGGKRSGCRRDEELNKTAGEIDSK